MMNLRMFMWKKAMLRGKFGWSQFLAPAYFRGFSSAEQNDIMDIASTNLKSILNKWYEYFAQ
jgi:hypothetical protein